MTSSDRNSGFSARTLTWWWSGAVLTLFLWTGICQWTWTHEQPFLHGVPAFFLGVLIIILVSAFARLVIGGVRNGWRWLMHWEALRVVGWTALFCISVIALFYSVELWRGKKAWAQVVSEAKHLGEPLSIEALIPPAVPDEQNFARAPLFAPLYRSNIQASTFTETNRMTAEERRLTGVEKLAGPFWGQNVIFAPWLNQQRTDFASWLRVHFKAQATANTNQAEAARELLKALQQYSSTVEEVRTFSARPYCQFPVPSDGRWLLGNQHDKAMTGLIHLLRLRASAELTVGEAHAAFSDAHLALRLCGAGWPEQSRPWCTGHMVQYPGLLNALQPLWEGLASHTWNKEQLGDFQQQLERLPIINTYPQAVRADRLTMAALVESLIPTTQVPSVPQVSMSPSDKSTLRVVRWFYPVGWSLQDQAAVHRYQFRYAARLVDAGSKRLGSAGEQDLRILWGSSDPFFPVFVIPKMREMAKYVFERFAPAQVARDQAFLACALERFRIEHGNYPLALKELVPNYLPSGPHDIVDGEPLRYQLLDHNRYQIYSVGFNRVDDGGKPCPRELDWQQHPSIMPSMGKGDWVWMYPDGQ